MLALSWVTLTNQQIFNSNVCTWLPSVGVKRAPTTMAKQNTITAKQLNAGWNAVVKETHTLNQVLKTFGGITSKKLPELEGLTVGEFLQENGIEVTKGRVSVGAIRKAWNEGMLVEGKLSVFRYAPVMWIPSECSDLYEKGRAYRVATKEQAEKYVKTGDCEFLRMLRLTPVDDYHWDTAVIAKAMKQGRKFAELNDESAMDELNWANLEEAYIVYDVVESDGMATRKMRRIAKDEARC